MEEDYSSPPRSSQYYGRDDRDQSSQKEPETRYRTEGAGPRISGQFEDTSYQTYPPTQPFLYDDYRRDTNKRVNALPQSNRQSVMSALKSLQEKIRQLELERSHAEDNIKSLSDETTRYRDILSQSQRDGSSSVKERSTSPDVDNTDRGNNDTTYANTTMGTDIHGKLDAAEHRCDILEKQMDYMRKMVQNSEHDRTDAIRRTALFEKEQDSSDVYEIKSKLAKIQDLERDHLKLTATQTLAENKIRGLEQKLTEERHFRKMIQDKSAEVGVELKDLYSLRIETAAEANRILLDAAGHTKPKKKKLKKKKVVASHARYQEYGSTSTKYGKKKPGTEPSEHYRLNLAEIPFVTGKSTGPSHSLAANFQNVLSLMKTHNSRLCKSPRNHLRSGYKYLNSQHRSSSSSGISSSSESDLADLMLQLQDEFGQMSFEHEELSKQIQEATDPRLHDDLERELDHLVARMEAKGDQIARLRRHQEQTLAKKHKHPKSAKKERLHTCARKSDNEDVEITTTVRSKGKNMGSVVINPNSGNRAQASLNLYKDLKKIQSTLQKDDLCWD